MQERGKNFVVRRKEWWGRIGLSLYTVRGMNEEMLVSTFLYGSETVTWYEEFKMRAVEMYFLRNKKD